MVFAKWSTRSDPALAAEIYVFIGAGSMAAGMIILAAAADSGRKLCARSDVLRRNMLIRAGSVIQDVVR